MAVEYITWQVVRFHAAGKQRGTATKHVDIEPCGPGTNWVMSKDGIDIRTHSSGYFINYNDSNGSLERYQNIPLIVWAGLNWILTYPYKCSYHLLLLEGPLHNTYLASIWNGLGSWDVLYCMWWETQYKVE